MGLLILKKARLDYYSADHELRIKNAPVAFWLTETFLMPRRSNEANMS